MIKHILAFLIATEKRGIQNRPQQVYVLIAIAMMKTPKGLNALDRFVKRAQNVEKDSIVSMAIVLIVKLRLFAQNQIFQDVDAAGASNVIGE